MKESNFIRIPLNNFECENDIILFNGKVVYHKDEGYILILKAGENNRELLDKSIILLKLFKNINISANGYYDCSYKNEKYFSYYINWEFGDNNFDYYILSSKESQSFIQFWEKYFTLIKPNNFALTKFQNEMYQPLLELKFVDLIQIFGAGLKRYHLPVKNDTTLSKHI
jgi:hydroxymethylpyrimidine pyrophosphatase-like HAD family hydrolase